MHNAVEFRKWLPAAWVAMAGAILAADYFVGSLVSLTILFIVPVALAARIDGRGWGIALGILMPVTHFMCAYSSVSRKGITDLAIDAGIRIAVLVAFAVLIDRTTRLAREVRVLHGLLPVCAFCRKVRGENDDWQPMETYITAHSEASFTHTFCPACALEHYGSYLKPKPPGGQQAVPSERSAAGAPAH
jgi:hypothetical protein